jgi:hypothetical protein
MSTLLFQPRVFDYLRNGGPLRGQQVSAQEWFDRAVAEAFKDIARRHGCTVTLSGDRLDEARKLWVGETNKIRVDGEEPDHFKQAGFLAYWLRRRVVINRKEEGDDPDGPGVATFLQFGNEICSFLLGFQLCLYFETGRISGEDRLKEIRETELTAEFVHDAAVVFFEKNVSPHAVYLFYRSLFYRLHPRPPQFQLLEFPR